MAGNKNKAKTVNNISQLNLEIDYDKLAEAIVKAQEQAKNGCRYPKVKGKFFPAIWMVIKGEKSKDGRFLSEPFKLLISFVFRTIALIGFLLLIIADVAAVKTIAEMVWQGWHILANILAVIIVISISFILLLYMVVLWGAANDIEHERDKDYVINVFSGIVSLAALVVAIIALLKGVG